MSICPSNTSTIHRSLQHVSRQHQMCSGIGRRQRSRGCSHIQAQAGDRSASRTQQQDSDSDQGQSSRQLSRAAARLRLGDTGWTSAEVYNWPNAISMARLLSGPAIGYMIVQGMWAPAVASLIISGASDWADGYVAKGYAQVSVLGSYLDPLADKVLIGCTIGALGYAGHLPPTIIAIIIGRDVFLVAASLLHRARTLGWRWLGLAEFLRIADQPAAAGHDREEQAGAHEAFGPVKPAEQAAGRPAARQTPEPAAAEDALLLKQQGHAAGLVQPLYISKVNTCLQLTLVAACLTQAWLAWPAAEVITGLGWLTAGTTVASCVAYIRMYASGKVL